MTLRKNQPFLGRKRLVRVQSNGRPDATYDAAAHTLSVAAMPLHATSLLAMRQPEGGVAELAGVSTGTTVSVVLFSPWLQE